MSVTDDVHTDGHATVTCVAIVNGCLIMITNVNSFVKCSACGMNHGTEVYVGCK